MQKAWLAEDSMEVWEGEGGAVLPAKRPLVGTVNQVAWAEQIRANVSAEFDRVVKALESREPSQTEQHQSEIAGLIFRHHFGSFVLKGCLLSKHLNMMAINWNTTPGS